MKKNKFCIGWFLHFLWNWFYINQKGLSLQKFNYSWFLYFITLFFIPYAVTINESTGWKPKWSLEFTLLFLTVCTFRAIIPTYYYSIKLYQKIEYKQLKKRWLCFNIGISGYFFLCYGTSYFCFLGHVDLIIWAIIATPSLINLFLIYYGIGRQMD